MRILRLDLRRFGHFTDHSLDLSAGQHGLHLVYGPNEAGKSTALRALHQLFYGIAARTEDGFLHPYAELRIGAVLTNSVGDHLECIRRKGNRNTLRAADDETVIDDGELAAWLGGVDEETFRRRYGINYEQLVAGGREIVAGHGDLGQSLFAAGAGVADLRGVQERLESEASDLFKSSGKKPRINELLSELKAARSRAKQLGLSTAEWKKHDKAYREAQEKYASLRRREAELSAERSRLERLRDAASLVRTFERLESDLAELRSTPLLSEGFSERRAEAQTSLAAAQSEARGAREDLEELEQSAASLTVSEPLLRHEAAITQCCEQSGAVREAEGDRVGLEAQLTEVEGDIRQLLRRLGADDVALDAIEPLRLPDAEVVRIQNLGGERKALEAAVEDARHRLARLQQRAAAVQRELDEIGELPDAAPLREAVRRAEREAERESERRQLQQTCASLADEADDRLAALGLWQGELDDARRLAVPGDETCDHWEQQLRAAEAVAKELRDGLAEERRRHEELAARLEELRLAQDVPTEDDLDASRRRRAAGWRLVREAWLADGAGEEKVREYTGDSAEPDRLAEAFTRDVAAADETADRLRREADRVALKLRLLGEQRNVAQRITSLEQQLAEAETALEGCRESWLKVWSPLGLEPRSPREMAAWLRRHARLVESVEQLRRAQDEAASQERRGDDCRKRLLAALRESTKVATSEQPVESSAKQPRMLTRNADSASLVELLAAAQEHLEILDATERRREKLAEESAELDAELADARQRGEEADLRLVDWNAQWSQAMQRLGLDPDADPSQANAVINLRQDVLQRAASAASLGRRLAGIAARADQFARRVRALAEEIFPDLAEDDPLRITEQFNAQLSDALKNQARRDEQQRRRERATKRLRDAVRAEEKHRATLAALCEEAACGSADELPEIERRSRERQQCEHDLRSVRQQLEKLSAGMPFDAFLAAVRERDFDEVAMRLRELGDELAEIEQQGEQLNQAIGAERTILAGMDGGAQAAEAEEEAQSLLAEIRTKTEEYARLKLAAAVLAGAVERYRERHQGPILQRAGELFAELTLGSFVGLRAEYFEGSKPELVGVRPDGRLVSVSGMSEGTCDQLYLALRLASLEHELEHREPLPLVVDDIMIMFDDDRSAAALKALARLSEKTQVILFTHHEHLVQLAEQTVDDDTLFVQNLARDAVRESAAAGR